MVADVDVCNMALGEIGARQIITDLEEDSPAAVQCRIFYTNIRQQLLRSAPWGFARKTLQLTPLGLASDDPTTWNQFPWLVKYAYPADCMKMRYILPPPFAVSEGSAPNVSGGTVYPFWGGPSRQCRFLIASDEEIEVPMRRVVLSNVIDAFGVYTCNIIDPDMFDPLFTNAFSMLLAAKIVLPLTGNAKMKADWVKLAEFNITAARVADGNEAIPVTDHVVDWMAVRGADSYNTGLGGFNWGTMGTYYSGFDNFSWGM